MATTIQVSDSLRKKLKVLASYRDMSYSDLLNDLVTVFETAVPFATEAEFADWFEDNLDKFGFEEILEKRKKDSPDYRLRKKNGEEQEVELELLGKNFVSHGHDPDQTDLIVCVFAEDDTINGVPAVPIVSSEELKDEIISQNRADYTSISVPRSLHSDVEDFIAGTGFTSVSEFLKHVMRDFLAAEKLSPESEGMKESMQEVRKKLKALGYYE